MTASELIEILKELPPDRLIFVSVAGGESAMAVTGVLTVYAHGPVGIDIDDGAWSQDDFYNVAVSVINI